MIALLASVALAADCPAPVVPDDLVAKLAEAEAAYEALEVDQFRSAMDEVALMVPCLDRVLEAKQASHLHTLTGLARFVGGQQTRAQQAFAAARATAATGEVLRRLVPEGHAIWELYAAVPLNVGTFVELPMPTEGTVHLDGLESVRRPERWATLFQHVGDGTTTVYLFPEQRPPTYPSVAPPPVEAPVVVAPMPEPLEQELRDEPTKLAGWIAVGVGGAVATGLGIAGAAREGAFLSETGPIQRAEAESVQRSINATYGAAIAVGGLTAAGAAVVVVW